MVVAAVLIDTLALWWRTSPALIALTVFFAAVYPGEARHQGLEYLFIVALLWLWHDARPTSAERVGNDPRGRVASGLVAALFAIHVLGSAHLYQFDVEATLSEAPAAGRWLRENDSYRNAILVGEPDYFLETIPYYAPNRLYFPREHRFGRWTKFTTANQSSLTLGALLDESRRLQVNAHAPVLILFSFWKQLEAGPATVTFAFGHQLSWDAADRTRFLSSVREVARFTGASGDEQYVVYALVPEQSASVQPPTIRERLDPLP